MSWLLEPNDTWPPGQPFGDNSDRWHRARGSASDSWDAGCYVTPLIGGKAAMDEIRAAFEAVINEASAGASCHVYIAGWRLNPNRDLSPNTSEWSTTNAADGNATAWGLIRRMIMARVKVRILIWLPPTDPITPGSFKAHVAAHFYLARLVQSANQRSRAIYTSETDDLGVVFLDTRTATEFPLLSTHHQKLVIVRGQATHTAFCGGVDLAYTRRDAPSLTGDWESGGHIPHNTIGIVELASPTDWEQQVTAVDDNQDSDLPETVASATGAATPMYGAENQLWHDQHLRLEGPVVATLEHVFCERWSDPAAAYVSLGADTAKLPAGSIITSTENAIDRGRILHRSYTTDAWRGTQTRPYYVGYGVSPSDIVAVRLSSQDVSTDNYRITPGGLSFITSRDGAPGPEFDGARPGSPLEIVYGSAQPKPLPDPEPVPGIVTTASNMDSLANTQIWLTIPNRGEARGAYEGVDKWAIFGESGVDASGFVSTVRDEEGTIVPIAPYRVGEFSNMAGIANACAQAKEFIWIFDQYFWSQPYARLIAARLRAQLSLHVAIVLPPWSDMGEGWFGDTQHALRYRALSLLGSADIRDRVAVYFPWYQADFRNVGIYAHAKVQLFDDQLMVCGSCNLNERSFSVDSEICCAVESLPVVQQHYRNLWEHFVAPSGGYPFPTTFTSGWGRALYLHLYGALSLSGTHYLRFDEGGHINNVTTLPNGAVRTSPLEGGLIDRAIEAQVSEPHGLPLGLYSTSDLQQIVATIENHRTGVRSPRMSIF